MKILNFNSCLLVAVCVAFLLVTLYSDMADAGKSGDIVWHNHRFIMRGKKDKEGDIVIDEWGRRR